MQDPPSLLTVPRNPKEEFWVSDCIINAVLKGMFFDYNNVQVIDICSIERAFKDADSGHLACDPEAHLIILPYHIVNHWFLIVSDTEVKKSFVFDGNFTQAPRQQALEEFLLIGLGNHIQNMVYQQVCVLILPDLILNELSDT